MSGNGNGIGRGYVRSSLRIYGVRDLSVNYEGRSEHIPARPPDLSTRGMFINTARIFPEGAILNVSFRLHRTSAQISARCEVRYCLPGVGVGVEFIEISSEAIRQIESEISQSDMKLVKPRSSRKRAKTSK
ncbi:MAG TPA: PilZ domain-containing protein [Candidatus Acidoferrales bacterium]|nr:PilZ domain-containing protein [Candidatus Acidoferrales bacterium]